MRNHGKGPKIVLVPKYPRWVRGYRKRVGTHVRGQDPKQPKRKSKLQLELDL